MKIIVDTDAGLDDAMAIFYLLRAERNAKLAQDSKGPEVMAITCVNGNTYLDNVAKNVLLVLQAVDRLDIPVYKGAAKSILITHDNTNYFGKDGLGDVNWPSPPSTDLIQSDHAVNALIKLVNENQGEITLLAMGPLTNIALAIRLDSMFLMKLKKLYILGGTVEGVGNVAPGIEFNFFMDPEANYIVLNDCDYKEHSVVLLPWESCHFMGVKNKWRRDNLGLVNSPEIDFMNKAEHIENYIEHEDWLYIDVMLSAVALDSSLITKMESHSVEAVTQGAFRGGLIVDSTDINKSKKKVDLIYRVSKEGYENSLISLFS